MTLELSLAEGILIAVDFGRELFAHMEWADSQVWRTVFASEEACADDTIRERLFHIHLTQWAFLHVWRDQRVEELLTLKKFQTLPELYAWMRPYYRQAATFLASVNSMQLNAPMPVPWVRLFDKKFTKQPSVPALGETVFQVPSHSTYHRGQVNIRLRELGAEPPLVDYIAWIWFGRPAAQWQELEAAPPG